MVLGTPAHRSPTVGPNPCRHRLYLSNRRNAFLTIPHGPFPYRPIALHTTSQSLSLLDSPSRLDPSCQLGRPPPAPTLPTTVADCECDAAPPSPRPLSSVLGAAVAFGFSWIVMLLLPYESAAASGGRMGGGSFDSSSTGWSGGSSLGSSSHTTSSYDSGSTHTMLDDFSWGSSGFRSLKQETGFVASVVPATPLSAPATINSWTSHLTFLAFACMFGAFALPNLLVRDASTVLKLQVGLLGTARSLQEDLDRIANISDPSTKYGLRNILTETILALLRHPDYFAFGFSNTDAQRNAARCEEKFNWVSTEERSKIDEETLVNTVNFRSHSKSRQRSDGLRNEYIVVTILVAAEGKHRLPVINGRENLKEALNKLASINSSKILALEVLWTPQDMDDILTEKELMLNYPLLRPL